MPGSPLYPLTVSSTSYASFVFNRSGHNSTRQEDNKGFNKKNKMTSYAPVAINEVVQGQPVSPVGFNGDGGVRRKWWWEAGPLDS